MQQNLTREFFGNLTRMVNNIINFRYNIINDSEQLSSLEKKQRLSLSQKNSMYLVQELSSILGENPIEQKKYHINMKDLINSSNKDTPALKIFEEIKNFIIQTKALIQEHSDKTIEIKHLILSIKSTQQNIMQLRNASTRLKPDNNIFTEELDKLARAVSDLLLTCHKVTHNLLTTPNTFTKFSSANSKTKKAKKQNQKLPNKKPPITALHQRNPGRNGNSK